jgi:hypothetical protein
MRDATGGTLLMQLVAVILAVFIFFIASVMQYARVYRIKGTIVDAIERGEGGIKSQDELTAVIASAQYEGAYEICKIYDPDRKGTYYKVTIYSYFTILPRFVTIKLPVKGETRTIDTGIFYDDTDDIFSSASSGCVKKD